MSFKAKSELLVPVLRINVISDLGCRSLCMAFLPPFSGVFRLSLSGSWPGIPCRRSFDFQGSMKACRKHITMKQKYLGSIPSGFQWILGGSQGKTGSNRSGLMWYWMNQRWFFWNEFFSKNMLIQRPLRCETSAFLCWTSGLGEAQQVFWSWICKIGFKNCKLVPTRPTYCGCKLENFCVEK